MARRYDIQEYQRGREAERPRDIPRAGWRDILLRTRSEMSEDYMGITAAGVAFYLLLAIFPALAALVSIYGLMFDPADVQRQMQGAMAVLPSQAAGILEGQLRSLTAQPSSGLGVGLIVGLLLAVWSSAKGVKALIQGLNIVYDEEERRGFFKLNAIALALTVAGLVFGVVTLALIAVVPALLGNLNLPEPLRVAISLIRWPILLVAVTLALAALYRFGPNRDQPRWQWVSWGAGVATVLWLVGSVLFSVYVANFGNYSQTYGSVGAVVVLMMWFFLTAYSILLGAELNAEIEHQTRRDTTEGEPQPMGQRGAHAADTLGRRP